MDDQNWLEQELAHVEQSLEKLASGTFGVSNSPNMPTEAEARDLEYHYFQIARTMRKMLDRERSR